MEEINSEYIIHLMCYLAPMLTSLICCLLVLGFCHFRAEPDQRKVVIPQLIGSATSAICWFLMIIYLCLPNFYVYIHPFFYLFLLVSPMFHHKMVFEVTNTDRGKKFPVIHYIIPLVLFVVLAIWSLCVPVDVHLANVKSRAVVPGYEWFTRLQTSAMKVYFLYKLIYPSLNLYYIHRYRKYIVNYSADEERSSVSWLYLLFYLSMATIPIALAPLIFPKERLILSLLMFVPYLISMFKDVLLSYNMITGNYVMINQDEKDRESQPVVAEAFTEKKVKELESYMKRQKPYLNPKLKITDLHPHIFMRRATLSALINQIYKMNFNCYINSYRLRELEELSKDPEFAELSKMELVAKAGFSNYRGYIRFVNSQKEPNRQLMK